jgi:hypothetical protein
LKGLSPQHQLGPNFLKVNLGGNTLKQQQYISLGETEIAIVAVMVNKSGKRVEDQVYLLMVD